jgi:IS30 family transposase
MSRVLIDMSILATDGMDKRQILIYLGVIALLVLVTTSMRRRSRQSKDYAPDAARQRMEELKAQRGVKSDMEQLLGEIQQLSRKISAEIDTKFAKLEASIADADRRIRTLQQLTQTAEGKRTVDVIVGDDGDAAATPASSSDEPRTTSAADRHVRVYELADTGKSLVEIAQTLGRPPGEIELILALRSKAS